MVKVDSRPGIRQGFIHIMPPGEPVASVILFAGGHGELKISGGTITWGNTNFLVRSRDKFAQQGFQVAVIDTPQDARGFLPLRRSTEEHLKDVRAVAEYLRSQANVPVWLIGTSMGTDSVGYLAVNGNEYFDGFIFTASANKTAHYDLQKVTKPAMAIHNKKDGCYGAIPGMEGLIYDKLVNAKRREKISVSSSRRGNSSECGALSPHGFLGIESEVVELIANFIKGE